MTKSNRRKKKVKTAASFPGGRKTVGGESPMNGDLPTLETPSLPATKGALKKKQRWEMKALKVKIDDLRKQKLKLSKTLPQERSSRKALEQQMKLLIEQQKVDHQNEVQQLEANKAAAENAMEEQHEAAQSTDSAVDHQEAVAVANVRQEVDFADVNMEIEGGRKSRSSRKSLAKKMKRSKAASKKRAWHLVAGDLGMIVNDSISTGKTRIHGLKVKKKTRVKLGAQTK